MRHGKYDGDDKQIYQDETREHCPKGALTYLQPAILVYQYSGVESWFGQLVEESLSWSLNGDAAKSSLGSDQKVLVA